MYIYSSYKLEMDDDSKKKKKDPKGLLSILAPIVIIITYSALDFLHRFLFIQRQADVNYDITELTPLVEKCPGMQVSTLSMNNISRRDFASVADNALIYARSFKMGFYQFAQDMLGLWTYPTQTSDSQPYTTLPFYVTRGASLTEMDWKHWKYYLFAIVVLAVLIIITFILMTTLWDDFQDGLELHKSFMPAFKYAYSRLNPTQKTLLIGIYIVLAVVTVKAYGRVMYHCGVYGVVFALTLTLLFLLLLFASVGDRIQEITETLTNTIVEKHNDIIKPTDTQEGGGSLSDFIIDKEALQNLKSNLSNDITTALGTIKKETSDAFLKAVRFLGLQCDQIALGSIPEIALKNKVKSVFKRLVKENASSNEELEGYEMIYDSVIPKEKYSLVGYVWLLSTDYIASIMNKGNKIVSSFDKCTTIDPIYQYDFSGSPFLSLVKFILFEKLGTQFLLAVVISVFVINGAYDLGEFVDIPGKMDQMWSGMMGVVKSDEDNEEAPQAENKSHEKRSSVTAIVTTIIIMSIFVLIMFSSYAALLITCKMYLSSQMTNWMTDMIPTDPKLMTIKDYICKEVIAHDHFDMQWVHSLGRCNWVKDSFKLVKQIVIVILVALGVASIITYCYSFVHFTSLKTTQEDKQKLGTSHFLNFHKALVITFTVIALFAALFGSMTE